MEDSVAGYCCGGMEDSVASRGVEDSVAIKKGCYGVLEKEMEFPLYI